MHKILFAICTLIGLIVLAQAEPVSPADLKSLLAQIQDKRGAMPQMQADFQEEKFIHLMTKPIMSAGKVWFQAPGKFRREVKGIHRA